ncbi:MULTISPECIES: helix-turn-helix domain-containing protein [Tenacibaculum]|uniref:helix-turn-helix domain-containing protein n=1 Tax=Tenacibaculum TaxID=104267 RepID=UPI001F0B2A16|nr:MULTISPECIES: helix-turn-helix transcriptional regulator [Tenacibaculum]MCH3882222.1 helix-turn-helix transcriptional regulator [Tenacibaculum aquimarinum]MCH3885234.1 helix-turn-helix transcriptional regulator [Tenacibaculum aquimarinum]MDO6599855.1 helix-turn-helix transcriptional regulator [Tenacibaculum sp. 1_MG-2023]
MVNTADFINRLKKVMEFHQLTASNFADAIGVQRSSISHILSGRNKPSLDFVLKITNTYTDVDMYWLLNGTGNFPKEKRQTTSSLPNLSASNNNSRSEKKIQRIVVFYEDGTFEEYNK